MAALLRAYMGDIARTYGKAPNLALAAMALAHVGLRAMLCYRLANACRRHRLTRPLAALLKRIGRVVSGAEIHPAARIGPGVHLPHPAGIVIGPTVKIEGECTIFQHVTLGPRTTGDDPEDGPTLCKHVFVYPGAKILGKVRIGSRTQIGPNCVVFKDIPEGSTVLPPEPMVLEGLSFKLRVQPSEQRAHEESIS